MKATVIKTDNCYLLTIHESWGTRTRILPLSTPLEVLREEYGYVEQDQD